MFDTSKLRGRIVEKVRTITQFCNVSGSDPSAVSRYLNTGDPISQKTICKWADALDIPADEIGLYFFRPKVHETEQEG